MNEQEALARMVPPGQRRPNKEQMLGGVIQIMITRACNLACTHCTQGSQLSGKPAVMSVEQFEEACKSLRGYPSVVGLFGGNPAMHPQFEDICAVMRKHIPANQRGIWCNHPRGKGAEMRRTFSPLRSNLNCHMDREAYREFKRDWPESMPFGLDSDSRHSPCFVAMKDLIPDEGKRWELISNCDINQHWSALMGVFRGNLRAYFCEIAYSQAILHEQEEDYPDTGLVIQGGYTHEGVSYDAWWKLPMQARVFREQVRQHCHSCGVPLRGYGALAVTEPNAKEQVSPTHAGNYRPKVKGRQVEVVTEMVQLGNRLATTVDYIGNSKR